MAVPIEIAEVTKAYAEVYAVRSVSLQIPAGKLTTILGPSGSGKSTMLNLIAGLTQPTSGRIIVDGADITSLPPARRNIGLVFQSYALFPHMSVYDNIAFPLKVRGVGSGEVRKRVQDALGLVRLPDHSHRKPSQLSGGQQQRVAIARALVFRPDILLLDEPLAALDRKLREEVRAEIRQIQESTGITTILVTHDQEEALSLSDQIVVLKDGEVQQMATPEEIYFKPSNRFIAEFLGDANVFNGRVQGRTLQVEGESSIPLGERAGQAGRLVHGILRPERARLQSSGDNANCVATVSSRVFLGSQVRYELKTDHGTRLLAVCSGAGPRHEPGDRVGVSWSPDDLWILADAKSLENSP